MLRTPYLISRPNYSKAPRGLFVLSWETRIFTGTSISPSPLLRQCPTRYSFRAGRNLPDKEFRYLRTVIVTAAVHRGLDSRLRTPLLVTFRHWAGVSPYTSAFALAETCVFGKQSVGPILCRLLIPSREARKLLRPPFSQSYGVNLPSSLTEGRSFTSRECSWPTCVGLRYGRSRFWIEAFLGGLGSDDFRVLAHPRPTCHAQCDRDLPRSRASRWAPGLSTCQDHLPYRVPPSLITNHSGAGISYLLAIAYYYYVHG